MLNFIVNKKGQAEYAVIVNKNYEHVATMPIAAWANKFDVADALISYVRETGIYPMLKRSNRC